MELDEFVENVGGEPLSEQQKELLNQMKDMADKYDFKVLVVGMETGRIPRLGITEAFLSLPRTKLDIPQICIEDFSKLEDRVMATVLKDRPFNRQLEKTILFGQRFSQCWIDDADLTLKHRFLDYDEVYEKPADHPTRKREPKGPRGKWGKLK